MELQQLRDRPDASAADQARFEALSELLRPFAVVMGPVVVGHSRLDHGVVGSDDDAARLRKVYDLLWPHNDYDLDGSDDASGTGRRRFRDAMHLATSIRYAFDVFITRDNHLRACRDRLSAEFPGFTVYDVDEATGVAMRRVAHLRQTSTLEGHSAYGLPLPLWPEPELRPTFADTPGASNV